MTFTEDDYSEREAEAREFFCCGDTEANARWFAMSDAERAEWTKGHGNLLSVKMERFRRAHPVAHFFISGEWAVALMQSMTLPYRAAWGWLRRG